MVNKNVTLPLPPRPHKIPVGAIIITLLVIVAGFAFFYWLEQRTNEPRITAKDRAQLEEFNRTGKVSGLDEEVNRNIAEFQRQQGIVPAPVVVPPAVRSDFKAEYKITGPAAKEIKFKFIASKEPGLVSWQLKTSDKPLSLRIIREIKDRSGKILESSDIEILVPANETREWQKYIEPEAQKMFINIEAKEAS